MVSSVSVLIIQRTKIRVSPVHSVCQLKPASRWSCLFLQNYSETLSEYFLLWNSGQLGGKNHDFFVIINAQNKDCSLSRSLLVFIKASFMVVSLVSSE